MNNTLSKNNIKHINDFLFVDNIRIISILSIVLLHVSLPFFELNKNERIYDNAFIRPFFFILQLGRFGNLSFFIVSGFLFGLHLKNNKNNGINYLKKRWRGLKKPLIIVSFLSSISIVIPEVAKFLIIGKDITSDLFINVSYSFFFGWTWFIFGYLLDILILCLLIKYLEKGIILINILIFLLVSFAPFINGYEIKSHTHWLVGFLPHLTLGYYLGMNLDYFHHVLNYIREHKVTIIIIILFLYFMATLEVLWLYNNTKVNPWFNLRPLNQLYSIGCFLFMCTFLNKKINYFILNVRRDTVGVFFLHFIVIHAYNFWLTAVLYYFFHISIVEIKEVFIYPFIVVEYMIVLGTIFWIINFFKKIHLSSYIGIT